MKEFNHILQGVSATLENYKDILNDVVRKNKTEKIRIDVGTEREIIIYFFGFHASVNENYCPFFCAYLKEGKMAMYKDNFNGVADVVMLVDFWCSRALHLFDPWRKTKKELKSYNIHQLGEYKVHARDTKKGVVYDVVQIVGYKTICDDVWTRETTFKFQTKFTTSYKEAKAICGYLNTLNKRVKTFRVKHFVKTYDDPQNCNKTLTLEYVWLKNSNITNKNYWLNFNVSTWRVIVEETQLKNYNYNEK